jgi:hypothetical protein
MSGTDSQDNFIDDGLEQQLEGLTHQEAELALHLASLGKLVTAAAAEDLWGLKTLLRRRAQPHAAYLRLIRYGEAAKPSSAELRMCLCVRARGEADMLISRIPVFPICACLHTCLHVPVCACMCAVCV